MTWTTGQGFGPAMLEFRALPTDDPKVRQPDITVARRELGWEPTVQLDEGLGRTIAYFRERLSA